ncbi:adenosine kinase [Methylobacterium isbiliense]|jgi:sugar/nucleoside kinase (ribokinase family)|uniref:Sugar kinase YdjH n=1 Tax=Methylobacterium isbiliense TaxID=315478 RepID=A0ABQ4S961_9HYPH|nr:adenosine kinase [Methylobacterium isbiliense]MDN3623595.1 adenosine kinase [Methylobacterium isbiliense]GJD99741.1 putative sugar kinase YdjH [Methylobacterium isbiliense]
MTAPLDLLVLGNAIVDIIARTDEAFLVREAVHKGAMQLIDEARAEHLFGVMGPATIVSGGSGANTAVGAALLGARTGFIGKVRDDELGRLFAHDLQATGVRFPVAAAAEGPATARCFILVTPDGERTMNTYLGACQGLSAADVDEATAGAARFVYLEGYLWDPPAAKDAFRKAAQVAHAAGNQVALTLSDAFCVDRYRDEFLGLIRDGSLDILFANIHELKSLYQTADAETALSALRAETGLLGVVTRSEEGALVVTRGETRAVPASPVREVVDTTGAGDLFAAGFLAGLARGLDHADCARLGAVAAAEVIQHIGARPQQDLKDLAAQQGL